MPATWTSWEPESGCLAGLPVRAAHAASAFPVVPGLLPQGECEVMALLLTVSAQDREDGVLQEVEGLLVVPDGRACRQAT